MHVLATRPQSRKSRQNLATNQIATFFMWILVSYVHSNKMNNFESQSVDEIWIFGGQHKISEIKFSPNQNDRVFIMKCRIIK